MAKPNQTKDMKPKENDELVKVPIDNNLKLVLINIISTILICVLLIGVNYLLQENLLNKNYLNNSLKETNGSLTTLTLVIPDADRNFTKLLKQKIDDTMVNNKTRYPKCDIMYSYTIYPEGIN